MREMIGREREGGRGRREKGFGVRNHGGLREKADCV